MTLYSYTIHYTHIRYIILMHDNVSYYSMSFCFVRFYAKFCFVVVFVVILSKTESKVMASREYSYLLDHLQTGLTTRTISAYTWPRLLFPLHMIGPLSSQRVSLIMRSFPAITWRPSDNVRNDRVHIISGGGYPKMLHVNVVSQVSYPMWYTSGASTKRGGTAKEM